MVSTLTDGAVALDRARRLHSFLSDELQLPLGKSAASVETFAAFMGMMRSCNPLHVRRAALRELPVTCPLVRRFPEVLTGKLSWYRDVSVGLSDVIDRGGPVVDSTKMWRLMVWIWLGNGGNMHQAWRCLQGTPCVRSYRRGDMRQPLEVLRFVMHAVAACGGLMSVIGSDGLDKKSRLAQRRGLYLAEWHAGVPRLVAAFRQGAEAFHAALCTLPGLRGELTRKEVLILFSVSRYRALREVGAPLLPFGQGAKNGARAFLGIAQMSGPTATQYYHRHLAGKIPEMEATLGRLFPALPRSDRRVTLGDIEPCLCAAFVYSGLVQNLRKVLGEGSGLLARDGEAAWQAVESMGAPAGFYAYTREGTPETGWQVRVPRVPYKRYRLEKVPPGHFLKRALAVRRWHLNPAEPRGMRKKRRAVEG